MVYDALLFFFFFLLPHVFFLHFPTLQSIDLSVL